MMKWGNHEVREWWGELGNRKTIFKNTGSNKKKNKNKRQKKKKKKEEEEEKT